jgi:aspartate 1-decarboxylase
MQHTLARAKIHRATVTDASLGYQGSITIGKELIRAAGLLPFELVHVNNLSNAAHWETYVIPGDCGQIILNGPPARLFTPGDLVVIIAYCGIPDYDVLNFKQTVVFVDEKNKITCVETKSMREYLDVCYNPQ